MSLPNTPEDRDVGKKAQQDNNATPHNSLCAACDDQVPQSAVWKAPCQHTYCTDCLEQLFRLSLEDEILYPPRCCQQAMPWSDVKTFVSHELVSEFEDKREELEAQDKTYCSEPACSAFIGLRYIAPDTLTATCPACGKLTCTTCKSASHAGDCPSDPSVLATFEIARQNGWRRCQQCGRMIERTGGCNHTT